jgi:hypothetical protein
MDDLTAVLRSMPEPPRAARVEMSQATFDHLKAGARPEGAPPDTGWRPVGWTPPAPFGSMLGIPVVLREDLGPGVWQAIDRDGEVIEEGTL